MTGEDIQVKVGERKRQVGGRQRESKEMELIGQSRCTEIAHQSKSLKDVVLCDDVVLLQRMAYQRKRHCSSQFSTANFN